MDIFPLSQFRSKVLLGLDIDVSKISGTDWLVIEVDLDTKLIECQPWSFKKKLKFGFYYPIEDNERESIKDSIKNILGKNKIIEIIDSLRFPSKEAIESLVWIPDRLKNNNVP